MLSDRLLAKTDYDCERELRTLELLKVRFGEANLHNAEVMLKVRALCSVWILLCILSQHSQHDLTIAVERNSWGVGSGFGGCCGIQAWANWKWLPTPTLC